jgi:hypothetical protein
LHCNGDRLSVCLGILNPLNAGRGAGRIDGRLLSKEEGFKMSRWADAKRSIYWPHGSRERFLKENGAKDLKDALEKAKKNPKPETAAQATLPRLTPSEAMTNAIKEIEDASFDLDLTNMPKSWIEKLDHLPTETVNQIEHWKTCWLKAIESYKKKDPGSKS